MIPKRKSPAVTLREYLVSQGATEAIKDLDALLAGYAAPPKPSPEREMASWVQTAIQVASGVAHGSTNDNNRHQANWMLVRARKAMDFAQQWAKAVEGKADE